MDDIFGLLAWPTIISLVTLNTGLLALTLFEQIGCVTIFSSMVYIRVRILGLFAARLLTNSITSNYLFLVVLGTSFPKALEINGKKLTLGASRSVKKKNCAGNFRMSCRNKLT